MPLLYSQSQSVAFLLTVYFDFLSVCFFTNTQSFIFIIHSNVHRSRTQLPVRCLFSLLAFTDVFIVSLSDLIVWHLLLQIHRGMFVSGTGVSFLLLSSVKIGSSD